MAAKVQGQYESGLIADDERRQELIEIWNKATNEIAQEMRSQPPADEPHQPHGVLRCSW